MHYCIRGKNSLFYFKLLIFLFIRQIIIQRIYTKLSGYFVRYMKIKLSVNGTLYLIELGCEDLFEISCYHKHFSVFLKQSCINLNHRITLFHHL